MRVKVPAGSLITIAPLAIGPRLQAASLHSFRMNTAWGGESYACGMDHVVRGVQRLTCQVKYNSHIVRCVILHISGCCSLLAARQTAMSPTHRSG